MKVAHQEVRNLPEIQPPIAYRPSRVTFGPTTAMLALLTVNEARHAIVFGWL
jgi:hypothetical protein